MVVKIDGSKGEGGGQIVRSALALSMVTGQPCEIVNIRAGRPKPGLMRQHLAAVRAAAEVCQADVQGASLGSTRLVFRPGAVAAGQYDFRIGTAGSTTLVLQTVLPALIVASGPTTLTLEGGTHNPLAPPFDFLVRTFLPQVARVGPRVTAELERHGFYPVGGGRMRVMVEPADAFREFHLTERGPIVSRRVRAVVANLPRHIGERECRTFAERSGWDPVGFRVDEVRGSRGPGNVLVVELESEHVTEVITAFGERGVRAEAVADRAWQETERYLDGGAPVAEHLADQLLMPLAVSAAHDGPGGEFLTTPLLSHATTHIDVLRAFLQIDVAVDHRDDGKCLIRVGR
jgi:RNA 3'-terminal phosphate cyclase (ATP)